MENRLFQIKNVIERFPEDLDSRSRRYAYHLSHMDEFVIQLLREEQVCDVQLPRLQKRHVLEENNELEPRVSLLEADDLDAD